MSGAALRAVLVDDTADIRLLLRTALEASGRFRVVGEAGDGEAGVELVGRTQPDVVLVDLAMPVMDGLEALPRIRRAAPGAVVAVLSGFDSAAMRRLAQEAGAQAYLQKGMSPYEVVRSLLALTGDGQAPGGAQPAPETRGVLDAAPFGIAVLDRADDALPVVQANAAAWELLGADPAGRPWAALRLCVLDQAAALGAEGRVAVAVQGVREPLAVTLAAVAPGVAAYLAPAGAAPAASDAGAWLRTAMARAAHEIRNPTVVIAGAVDALTRSQPPLAPELRRDLLAAVARQSRLLDRATADLLTAAQAQRGALRVQARPVDLTEALRAAVADAPGLTEVAVECPPGLAVLADPVRLQQMLLNLLSNAAKYGAPPVAVRAARERKQVCVTVHDAGPGVPEEFRPELFEEFARAEGVGAAGTGLGLHVVRSLAAAHGGTAWFEPGPGCGSTFGFTLPAAAGAE